GVVTRPSALPDRAQREPLPDIEHVAGAYLFRTFCGLCTHLVPDGLLLAFVRLARRLKGGTFGGRGPLPGPRPAPPPLARRPAAGIDARSALSLPILRGESVALP